MNRLLTLLFCIPLIGCVTVTPHPLSREQILERTKLELSKREAWVKDACISIHEDSDSKKWRWKVTANAIDTKTHPNCGCALFVPGTGRELYFSYTGRLMIYQNQ